MAKGKDDDHEDEYIDEGSLGDWRSFRNSLLETGLSSPADKDGYVGDDALSTDSSDLDVPTDSVGGKNDDDSITTDSQSRPKSVSKKNEELLMKQNKKLAEEYLDGVWAHEVPEVEVGGLAVRLPLEAEIYRSEDKSDIGKELIRRIDTDDGGQTNTAFLSNNNDEKIGTFKKENTPSKKQPEVSFSLSAAKTILWYKKAQNLIDEELQGVASAANERGEIDPSELKPSTADFLKLYLDNQETWQEVCLVLQKNDIDRSAISLVINRPMAFKLSENLARLVLFGAYEAMAMEQKGGGVSKVQKLVKFLTAFENACAVYVGGPDRMDEPARLIHGFADLEGAREIYPGTGVYEGGLDAAIDGVTKGKYNSMDFRFFVGCHQYIDGELDVAVYKNKYQPIACARSLILKQCIQLPKPLWHEIVELCGGELREISNLELMKRDDIE